MTVSRQDWRNRAIKDLERLDEETRERITDAVDLYAATRRGDVEKIKGRKNQYRLRVGVWRVLIERKRGEDVISILHVRHRSEAYQP